MPFSFFLPPDQHTPHYHHHHLSSSSDWLPSLKLPLLHRTTITDSTDVTFIFYLWRWNITNVYIFMYLYFSSIMYVTVESLYFLQEDPRNSVRKNVKHLAYLRLFLRASNFSPLHFFIILKIMVVALLSFTSSRPFYLFLPYHISLFNHIYNVILLFSWKIPKKWQQNRRILLPYLFRIHITVARRNWKRFSS